LCLAHVQIMKIDPRGSAHQLDRTVTVGFLHRFSMI
jgi:hypothetical protein